MPPMKKIRAEEIIDAAYDIARKDGLEAVNARSLAKELGCSVQPIFSNFHSMQALKGKIMEKMADTFHRFLQKGRQADKPYKGVGMAYIRFAKEEPVLFRCLFMNEVDVEYEKYILLDGQSFQNSMETGEMATGLEEEKMKLFHRNMFVFSHGIATLIATKTCTFSDEQISDMLTEVFQGQMALLGKERECV